MKYIILVTFVLCCSCVNFDSKTTPEIENVLPKNQKKITQVKPISLDYLQDNVDYAEEDIIKKIATIDTQIIVATGGLKKSLIRERQQLQSILDTMSVNTVFKVSNSSNSNKVLDTTEASINEIERPVQQ